MMDTDWKSILLNAIAAGLLGAFIALLIALSRSPVVAPALSVLLSAAILFLALTDRLPKSTERTLSPEVLARIIGFSFAASVALLAGIYLRANNAFGRSAIVATYQDLVAIGYTEDQARQFVVGSLARHKPGDAADAPEDTKQISDSRGAQPNATTQEVPPEPTAGPAAASSIPGAGVPPSDATKTEVSGVDRPAEAVPGSSPIPPTQVAELRTPGLDGGKPDSGQTPIPDPSEYIDASASGFPIWFVAVLTITVLAALLIFLWPRRRTPGRDV